MRIRQMAFSSRLKAHRHLLTLETLRFIGEFLVDRNVKQAAIRAGIPETYASRHGQWLMKLPAVQTALDRELDDRDMLELRRSLDEIEAQMQNCRILLGLEEF